MVAVNATMYKCKLYMCHVVIFQQTDVGDNAQRGCDLAKKKKKNGRVTCPPHYAGQCRVHSVLRRNAGADLSCTPYKSNQF